MLRSVYRMGLCPLHPLIYLVSELVPVLADLMPSGKYEMAHLVKIGGTLPLMKMLLKEGLHHGDCLTVTGKTVLGSRLSTSPMSILA